MQSGGAFQSDITATTVALTDTTDGATIQFDSNLDAVALNTTAGNGYNLTFNSDSTSINNALIFSNSGVLTFGNAASDDILFNGGATTDSAAIVNVFGRVRTTGNILGGNVVVGGASSLETVGANLILSGISGNGGSQALDLNSGAITVSGVVDGVAITVKDSGGATFKAKLAVPMPSLSIENTTAG